LAAPCITSVFKSLSLNCRPTNVPANAALQLMVNSHEGKKPSTTWTKPSGRPRRTWLNHIQDADARPLSTIWRSEVARGHGGAQRSVRTSRWWWWCRPISDCEVAYFLRFNFFCFALWLNSKSVWRSEQEILPSRNTPLQLLTLYNEPEHHFSAIVLLKHQRNPFLLDAYCYIVGIVGQCFFINKNVAKKRLLEN